MEEEIKLIVIIILTLCTMWKFKSTCQKLEKSSKARKKNTLSEVPLQLTNCDEEKMIDTQCAIIDSIIFPPTPRSVNSKRRLIKTQHRQQSDYKRSLTISPNCSSQSTLIYNNDFFNKSLFNTPVNRLIAINNQQYLRSIEHLTIEPFTTESSGMCIQQEQEESNARQAVPTKRKTILKRKTFRRLREGSQKMTLPKNAKGSKKRVKSKSKSKSQSVIDIDQEIKKREQQIQVLKRLKEQVQKIRQS